MIVNRLDVPIVLAPLAGGPSTPQLAASVSNAGGFGFLAAGYLAATELAKRIAQARTLTDAPIGVNVFVPGTPTPGPIVAEYAAQLAGEARSAGVALGPARFEDDGWTQKLDLLSAEPVAVVSFTFGCPPRDVIDRLHLSGSEVWVTITHPAEAVAAVDAGADALVVQGSEAGGHRASFRDDADDLTGGVGLLALLQLTRARVDIPLVASGGISTGEGVAAVLAAGAGAAQLGTAFLRCPEAGTTDVHRRALAGDAPTATTRAFTGRLARGIRNRFLTDHTAQAPVAYPEVHHLTAPLRQAGRAAGEPDLVNLWAGQSYQLGRAMPAAELVRQLGDETRAALDRALARLH